MGNKVDKAAGVKTTPNAKLGKEVKPPKQFSTSDTSIKDLAIAEICVLREDNEALKKDLDRANGLIIDYERKLKQLMDKNDLLKEDFIQVTKAFCLVK